MYDAISDHLPMLLALEDAIYVLQPSLDGVSGFLIGRCSSNDAYLFAI